MYRKVCVGGLQIPYHFIDGAWALSSDFGICGDPRINPPNTKGHFISQCLVTQSVPHLPANRVGLEQTTRKLLASS